MKIVLVAGARPNFVKIAPLMEAFSKVAGFETILVHTGQHYDKQMSAMFFEELGIPEPDVNLGVHSGSHAVQTAEIMKAFEQVVLTQKPEAVLVVGDVNSTVACGLVAVKLGIKLIHVEAGLRSFDRSMPEEINRMVTDSISDLLFVSEESGVTNLKNEGVADARVHMVGNVMIDTLLKHRARAENSNVLSVLGLRAGGYAVSTLHRPSNVDDPMALTRILDAFEQIQADLPIVLPLHPRTRHALREFGFQARIDRMSGLRIIDPLGYLDFLKLMSNAKVVITDSGGIQEETTVLKVPCITMRDNTERPATIEAGANQLVGTQTQAIVDAYRKIEKCGDLKLPKFWDGKAAARVVEIIQREAEALTLANRDQEQFQTRTTDRR